MGAPRRFKQQGQLRIHLEACSHRRGRAFAGTPRPQLTFARFQNVIGHCCSVRSCGVPFSIPVAVPRSVGQGSKVACGQMVDTLYIYVCTFDTYIWKHILRTCINIVKLRKYGTTLGLESSSTDPNIPFRIRAKSQT